MARFKAIWGPLKEEVDGRRIKWTFSCVYETGEVQGYCLRFYFNTRKFSVRPLRGQANRYAQRMGEKDLFALPEIQRAETISGKRVTDILKAHLGDERIAKATALAIQYGRK